MTTPEWSTRISPKTPNKWLKERGGAIMNSKDLRRIANDILDNAKEVAPGIDWQLVSTHIISNAGSGPLPYQGEAAIAHAVVSTVGPVAAQMGWDMHSPEVVFMSCYHIFWSLDKDLTRMQARIKYAEEGTRKFVSDEAKEKQLDMERQEARDLAVQHESLRLSLAEYTRQSLPQDEVYLNILRFLPYLGRMRIDANRRHRVFALLKQGEYVKAAKLLKGRISP